MTILSDLISQYTNLSDTDFIVHDLLDKTIRVIIYDGDQSIAAIEKIYGQEFAIALVVGMKNILTALRNDNTSQSNATADYLSIYFDRVTIGSGLNFADPTVQERLDSLAVYLTPQVVSKLKAMGSILKSKWEISTNESEPTEEEILSAIQDEVNKRKTADWVSYVRNGILANNGNGKSISELKLLIAERN